MARAAGKKTVARFARHRTHAELKSACKAKGWKFFDLLYRKNGEDHVSFYFDGIGVKGECFYNTFNGRFFGITRSGISFRSDEQTHDNKRWFRALLNFVYVRHAEAM